MYRHNTGAGYNKIVMVMSGGEVTSLQPESPLDVLSRAASMVESGASDSQSDSEPSPPKMSQVQERVSSSFKEIHPKFRRHLATPPPYTPPASSTASSSPEEAPLDFSIRKRSLSPSSSDGPPPYKYSNPLRQGSPPVARSHHLPIAPAPSYFRPPPYPRTPSPPPPPPPPAPANTSDSSHRPPPPSYEAAMASKPSSPTLNPLTTTSPTFSTLTSRPSPTVKTEYTLSRTSQGQGSPTSKTDSPPRPSVICTGPQAGGKEPSQGLHIANLFKKEEDKENTDSSEVRRNRKREVTIVEESGAVDLMEEHFRKSLGDDYSKVFKESEKKKNDEADKMDVDPVKAFKDDLDMTGYTVDDHFAKALGPAWAKLQEAEKEKKPSVSPKPTQLVAL